MDNREENEPRCVIIRLYGIVQGVGFRPFTVKLAESLGVTGTVKNSGGMVDITACGGKTQLNAFISRLFVEKPAQAAVLYSDTVDLPFAHFSAFTILPSQAAEGPVFLPPDLGVCADCLSETENKNDRRYAHPFASCAVCGPRYSVIEETPYDRPVTTMRDFDMCADCEKEYTDRQDRRFHAQTISCRECGPYLIFKSGGSEAFRDEAFENAAEVLRRGGVIAVKGVGGYHLCCSPFDRRAVLRLREIKQRDAKPFAVMFSSIDDVRQYARLSEKEETLLQSQARPIVLLERKEGGLEESVCGESRYVGAFLPYTPLHAMLVSAAGPLVMTSANISEQPIIKDDEPMAAWSGLDGVLFHTRRIAARLDDSVLKVAAGGVQVIRRSRGYAPMPVILSGFDRGAVFAAGAQLKSAFCLASGPFAHMSPHIGDLDSEDCIDAYRESYERLTKLLRIKPELAVCDQHPGYASTEFAESLKLPLLRVQHHHAHIASVLAEHAVEGPVIGAAFDGTGWGCDGSVWGGEFFICGGNRFERAGHIKPVRFLGGDESMKDAAKSAMCCLLDAGLEAHIRDERWPLIRAALENGVNTHANSGMGRLFDAACAVLGVCGYNRYEGECAIRLENLAAQALEQGAAPMPMAFDIYENAKMLIADAAPVMKALTQAAGKRAAALGFHTAVKDMALGMIKRLSERTGIKAVALSGGVFQNAVLLQSLKTELGTSGYSVYVNESVPPNDGGIGLGQAYIGLNVLKGLAYECV